MSELVKNWFNHKFSQTPMGIEYPEAVHGCSLCLNAFFSHVDEHKILVENKSFTLLDGTQIKHKPCLLIKDLTKLKEDATPIFQSWESILLQYADKPLVQQSILIFLWSIFFPLNLVVDHDWNIVLGYIKAVPIWVSRPEDTFTWTRLLLFAPPELLVAFEKNEVPLWFEHYKKVCLNEDIKSKCNMFELGPLYMRTSMENMYDSSSFFKSSPGKTFLSWFVKHQNQHGIANFSTLYVEHPKEPYILINVPILYNSTGKKKDVVIKSNKKMRDSIKLYTTQKAKDNPAYAIDHYRSVISEIRMNVPLEFLKALDQGSLEKQGDPNFLVNLSNPYVTYWEYPSYQKFVEKFTAYLNKDYTKITFVEYAALTFTLFSSAKKSSFKTPKKNSTSLPVFRIHKNAQISCVGGALFAFYIKGMIARYVEKNPILNLKYFREVLQYFYRKNVLLPSDNFNIELCEQYIPEYPSSLGDMITFEHPAVVLRCMSRYGEKSYSNLDSSIKLPASLSFDLEDLDFFLKTPNSDFDPVVVDYLKFFYEELQSS